MSGEAQGPDISTLIGKAKGELATIPKIPQDEYMGIDRAPGEEPLHAKALKEKVAPKMPETRPESVRVENDQKTQPALDSIRWSLVPTGDTTTEESPVLGEKTQEQTDEQRKANLLSRAEAYRKTDQGQYYLSGQVLGRFGHNYRGLSSTTNGTMPEELQAMLVLSGDYGLGRESDTYAEHVYYAAASALRKDQGGDSSSWRGIEGYVPQGAAKAVLEAAKKAKNSIPLTEDDLTRCMITALACGAPLEALQMASLAKDYVRLPRGEREPDKYDAGQIVVGRLMTKYGEHSFDRAYALSPESTKKRIDAEFSTLDQNPKYSDLLQYPGVALLIEKSKARMDARLHREQSSWYEAQKVRDVGALEASLDTEHLKSLSEKTAIEGDEFGVIEVEVVKRAQEVIDGEIANMIGAELMRRLHPELTVANIGAVLRARTLNDEVRRLPAYHVYNEYRTIFDDSKGIQLSPSDRQKKVEGVSTSDTGTMVAREFSWEGGQRLKSLIVLLKNPNYFTYVLGNEMRGKTNDAAAQATREQIARALIQGVTFLQAICEDEDVRHIAERELGLVGYLDPGEEGALGKAQAELRRTFADQKDAEPDETKNSGLTLYDTALAEGQLERDTEVVELITRARSKGAEVLSNQKITEVKAIVGASVTAVTKELEDLVERKENHESLLRKKTDIEEEIAVLAQQRSEVSAQQVANSWVERKLHPGWPSSAEKSAQLASIEISIQTKQQDEASLQGEIEKSTEVTDKHVELAQKKADGIAKLARQAHGVE